MMYIWVFRLHDIPVAEELRILFRTGVLPISYVLQLSEAELQAEDWYVEDGWSLEKDLLLFRSSLQHFFSWNSLLLDQVLLFTNVYVLFFTLLTFSLRI